METAEGGSAWALPLLRRKASVNFVPIPRGISFLYPGESQTGYTKADSRAIKNKVSPVGELTNFFWTSAVKIL